MNWYLEVLKKYAEFNGRARRKEYWMFFLFNMIVAVILTFIEEVVGMRQVGDRGILSTLYLFAVLLPAIAVGVRRLHDIGRSGWWLLIGLVPILGAIVLLVFTVRDSDRGDNEYGPNPKAIALA